MDIKYRYNKLAEMKNDKMQMPNGESREGDSLPEDTVVYSFTLFAYFLIFISSINLCSRQQLNTII